MPERNSAAAGSHVRHAMPLIRQRGPRILAQLSQRWLSDEFRETFTRTESPGRRPASWALGPVFLSAKDRAAWEAAGRPSRGLPIDRDFGPGELWFEDFTRY